MRKIAPVLVFALIADDGVFLLRAAWLLEP